MDGNNSEFGDESFYNTVVESLFMVHWTVGLIPNGGPIELFLVSASAHWHHLRCVRMMPGLTFSKT